MSHVCARQLLTLEYVASESSVVATLMTDGNDGSAGRVTDRLRCILADEVATNYANLRYHLLVLQPGSTDVWVDLDEMQRPLPSSSTGAEGASREAVEQADLLRQDLSLWLTDRCTFYFVDAQRLREEPSALPRMLRLQDMLVQHPSLIVQREIVLEQACRGAYAAVGRTPPWAVHRHGA